MKRNHKGSLICSSKALLIVLMVYFVCPLEIVFPHNLELFVSPNGMDNNSGRIITSPFQTLIRVQEEIRKLNSMGGSQDTIVVYMRGGNYFFDKPLIFRPLDSGYGLYPIIYTGYNGEMPIINGGKRVENWNVLKNGIWCTHIPQINGDRWTFTELYINGSKRKIAQTPHKGFLKVVGFPEGIAKDYHTISKRFNYFDRDINPFWINMDNIEVVVYHFWNDEHLRIQSIDTIYRIVEFKAPAKKRFTEAFDSSGARYIVKNVFEAMDRPGEWYLNRKTDTLYYKPYPGEDLRDSEVVAPYAEKLLLLQGDPLKQQYVQHLIFKGITFCYTNWKLPLENTNSIQGAVSIPAAISFSGSRYCTLTNCIIKNVNIYGVEIVKGGFRNAIEQNQIFSTGGGGIFVNGDFKDSSTLLRTDENIISDNVIHDYGENFQSSAGILLGHSSSNTISHNLIHHGYYTGISAGWWDYDYKTSLSKNNLIEFNEVHDIGQGLLSDMGGIYTLGVSPGTVIRNNLVFNINAYSYGGWGIYLDNASSYIVVKNNIVYNTSQSGFNFHYGMDDSVYNNIFAFGRDSQVSRSENESHVSFYFGHNIVFWNSGQLLNGNWKNVPDSSNGHPKESVAGKVNKTYSLDYNIYYRPNFNEDSVLFDHKHFAVWKAEGNDLHSLFVDPLFADPYDDNFTLKLNSPAFDLGFKPIDIHDVGPRLAKGK